MSYKNAIVRYDVKPASGFLLTGIKANTQTWVSPDGYVVSRTSMTKAKWITDNGGASMKKYQVMGFKPLKGFQLRYIYFLDKSQQKNLTVPILPFSVIDEMGARMYKGVKLADGQ